MSKKIGKIQILFYVIVLILIVFLVTHKTLTENFFLKKESSAVQATPPKPFVILIVPGHDTDSGGANFKDTYERNLVVDVAEDISSLLSPNQKYKVIIARNTHLWNPLFTDYFTNNEQAILDFKINHQQANKLSIASGETKVIHDAAVHTIANAKTSLELYGINKWANENDVDLVIHLHFNSSARKNMNKAGSNHGFNIFIPQKDRVNALPSRIAAEDIYNELAKKFSPETSGNHYDSLYEDQSLIALGAANTLDKPAVLIEYAYIYEKILQSETTRNQALEEMAEQTVVGIDDYTSSLNIKH